MEKETKPRTFVKSNTKLHGFFADAQHGYAFGGGKTVTGKRFQGILFSVVYAYHLQAGDAALHAVVLLVKRKHDD